MSGRIERCKHGNPMSLVCGKCDTESVDYALAELARANGVSEEDTRRQFEAFGRDLGKFAANFGLAAKKMGAAMAEAGQAMASAMAGGRKLTAEEEADLCAISQRETFGADALRAALRRYTWPELTAGDVRQLTPAIAQAALQVQRRSRDRATGVERLKKGELLSSWSKDELMAQLPIYVKDQPIEQRSHLQLMCLTQYTLDNCSQKDAVSYDGALQLKLGPELLRRFQGLLPSTPQQAPEVASFRTAWELFRSGGATLEEIAPLMDKALAPPEPEPEIVVDQQAQPSSFVKPFSKVVGQTPPQVGQPIRVHGKRYRCLAISTDGSGKRILKLGEIKTVGDSATEPGSHFWVEWE